MVTPAEGESIVLHHMRRRNTWRRWSAGYNPERCLPIHHSARVGRSCVKPLRWLAGPEWFTHWLIISCYNPVSMWPQRRWQANEEMVMKMKEREAEGEEDTRATSSSVFLRLTFHIKIQISPHWTVVLDDTDRTALIEYFLSFFLYV